MENFTRIESSDIETIFYSSGLIKEKKLVAIKKSITIEINNKQRWKQYIDVCDLRGNLLVRRVNGYLGPFHYATFRKTYILCYKNFFIVCDNEVIKNNNSENSISNSYSAFTYTGKILDYNAYGWKKDKEKIKYYSTLAKNKDKDNSK